MQTVGELIEALKKFAPETPIVLVQRIKTGYDEGDIWHSIGISVVSSFSAVELHSDGSKCVGGW